MDCLSYSLHFLRETDMLINLCIPECMCLQTTFDFIFCQLQMTQINGTLQATCFQTFYCIFRRHICFIISRIVRDFAKKCHSYATRKNIVMEFIIKNGYFMHLALG